MSVVPSTEYGSATPKRYLEQPLDIPLVRRHPERSPHCPDRVRAVAGTHPAPELRKAPSGALRFGDAGAGAIGDEAERCLRRPGIAEAPAAHRHAGTARVLFHLIVRTGCAVRVEHVD